MLMLEAEEAPHNLRKLEEDNNEDIFIAVTIIGGAILVGVSFFCFCQVNTNYDINHADFYLEHY